METSDCPQQQASDLIRCGALALNDFYRVRNSGLGPFGLPFVRGWDFGGSGARNEGRRSHPA